MTDRGRETAHIGVVGGVGPFAGVDLVSKVLRLTVAATDQEHIPLTMISEPGAIEDRSRFLLGESSVNPAHAVVEIIERLAACGATVVGIPCCTMHAPPIFDIIESSTHEAVPQVTLVHLVREVVRIVRERRPAGGRVGILATAGAYHGRMFLDDLENAGLEPIVPGRAARRAIHRAIYDRSFGIKSHASPVSGQARVILASAVDELDRRGADLIIAGCTELAYALPQVDMEHPPLIDATLALARGLVGRAAPERLRG